MNDANEITGWKNPESSEIENILDNSKTIAMVGLSSKPDRASNEVARYLQKKGYEIIPVNPREMEILGQKAYPDLTSIGRKVDVVDVFRKAEDTPPIVEEAIRCGAGCIWLQLGIISKESQQLASKAGVPFIMDACMLREHKRLKS